MAWIIKITGPYNKNDKKKIYIILYLTVKMVFISYIFYLNN